MFIYKYIYIKPQHKVLSSHLYLQTNALFIETNNEPTLEICFMWGIIASI